MHSTFSFKNDLCANQMTIHSVAVFALKIYAYLKKNYTVHNDHKRKNLWWVL